MVFFKKNHGYLFRYLITCQKASILLDSVLRAVDIGSELEPFDVPLVDLEKDAKPVTTLNEQCKRFVNHYSILFQIRRQVAYWKQSGLPAGAQKALTTCYSRCKETDPVSVFL
ncbi:hypothetical protein TELCIR_13652 [Teladorsagia circumcincta]|uniref:Uncharacterized protein n=1 Tax=Teladorsagia circumcincta TaxID=45464 RepID=A0A2G9U382_TELCI|nr:hypothetical protein TELCIR_13652 [Teladorsagia circumcincta]